MKRLVIATSGVLTGVCMATSSAVFSGGCGQDCGEHPPDPYVAEYVVVDSTQSQFVGARVSVTCCRYGSLYSVVLQGDSDSGPFKVAWGYFGIGPRATAAEAE